MAFRTFLKAELPVLQTSKAGDVEDLASIKLSEAGLDDTVLENFPGDVDVPKSTKTLHKIVLQAKDAFEPSAITHREGVEPRGSEGHAIPLSTIKELLCLLEISDVCRTPRGRRQMATPCPFAARNLYDRLVLARRHAWWVGTLPRQVVRLAGRRLGEKENGTSRWRRSWSITDSELSGLLEPVIREMRACLGYVELFCRPVETSTGGICRGSCWVDLSGLRTCVFRIMGFWPHDVVEDYPGYAFDLPSELGMLLYPQICLDRDEMVDNLEEVVLVPGWGILRRLEEIAYGL